MAEFFQSNRDVVYFVYGQAFFVLGLAIALQSRKHSQLALGTHMGWLAVFGIVHGIYEWGAVFIPIQQASLSDDVIIGLRLLRLALEAISFVTLFQFGVELTTPRHPIHLLPIITLGIWGGLYFTLQARGGVSFAESRDLGDTLLRYLLGVPGAATAAWGLWRQAQHVSHLNSPRIANYLRGAAIAFAVYTGLVGIVPQGNFFPASVLNYDLLTSTIGIPAAVFRATCGILIAFLIIRALEIFNVETDRQIEEAARLRAIALDRERIGRDLHDGIIQSLYGSGLMLEDAALTIGDDATRARAKISQVIDALNRTVRDIRSYILDLRRPGDNGNWESDLGELTRAFRLQTLVDTEFRVEGQPRAEPSAQAKQEILAIAREALVNIAKHARATRVAIKLMHCLDQIELEIADNGIGFALPDPSASPSAGWQQGLRNMHERARLIGARLTIESAPQRGTRVRVNMPIAKE